MPYRTVRNLAHPAAPVLLDICIPEGALCALAGIGLRRRLSL